MCRSQGPSLNGYKCNLHFWHAQNEFPFFVLTCIDIQFERSRVQKYYPFRQWFYHGLYVGLHVPGNILLHSLSLYCFHCTRKRPLWDLRKNNFALSRSGYCSFARRYVNFSYNVFDRRHKFTSGHPSPHQKNKQTNKQQQQTIKTNK